MTSKDTIIEPDAADLAQARDIYRRLIRRSACGESLSPDDSEQLARAAKRLGITAAGTGSDVLLMQDGIKAEAAGKELRTAAKSLDADTDRLEFLLTKYEGVFAEVDQLRQRTMQTTQRINEHRQVIETFKAKARSRPDLFAEEL